MSKVAFVIVLSKQGITAAWQIIMEMEAGIPDVGVDMVEEVEGVEGEVAILVGEEEEAMEVVEKCNIISLVVTTTLVNPMDHLPKAEVGYMSVDIWIIFRTMSTFLFSDPN